MKKLYLLFNLCVIFIVFSNRSYSQCFFAVNYGSLRSTQELYPSGWAGTQYFAPALWNNIGIYPGLLGEEQIVKFIPPGSGAYDFIITNTFYMGVGAMWRKSNDTCNLNGYQFPATYNSYNDIDFTLSNLTAGDDYNIIVFPFDSNVTGNAAITITCGNVKNISVSNVQTTSAVLNFDCACPNPVILEYGPAGFTPGTATSGNGTMVANVTSPYTITGLSPYVIYDVYLRSACGTIYSDNAKVTFRSSIDCANAPVLTCGSTFTYSHNLGDNSGNWSINCLSTGNNSSEAVYRFTPAQSGMYLLTNYSGSYYTGNSIAAYYKPMGTCDTSGWNCIGAITQHPQGVTFGPLTANSTYLLLFDANSNAGNTIKNMRIDCVNPCTATITPTSTITICQGKTATWQANTGAGITYQWYLNGFIVPGATASSYTSSSEGWYSVVENTPCGTVTSDNRYVNVSSAVSAPVTYNTPLTFCPNGYVQLNAAPNYYATTYHWQRNGVNLPGATQMSYQATDSGTYRVKASAAGCTLAYSNNFTVNKATSVTGFYIATSSGTICAGGNILLSIKNSQSFPPDYLPTPGYTYQWKKNGANISGANTTAYNVTSAGSYTCEVTATCGTYTTAARVITAYTLPTVSLAANGPTTFCDSYVNLTATIMGSGGLSTTWKRNGVVFFTGYSGQESAYETGTYVCEVTNYCGTVVSNAISVTANKSPVLSAIIGSTGFCRPSTGNVYSVTPQAGVTFNWTLPFGATITNGQGTNSVTVSFSSNASAGTICVVGSNAICGAGAAICKSIVLRTAVSTPGVITGSTNACRQSWIYSIKKVPNAEYYTWNPPQGAKVNGSAATLQTPDTVVVLQFDSTFTDDTLRVRAVNCSGTSGVRKLRINNGPPAPGTITGSVYANCNTSKTYSIDPVADAVSYTWRTTVPGALIYGSSLPYTTWATSVSVTFTNGLNGKIYVKSNSLCNSSAEKVLSVYSKPAAPTAITGPVTVCDSALLVNYSTPLITGASTYNWTILSGSTIANGQGTNSINVNFGGTATTGNIKVRAQNVCANSAYFSKAITINNCNRLMSEDAKAELQLYPNPFISTAMLTIPAEINLDASEVSIYNVMGKQVRVISKPEQYTLEIERKNLPPGIYFIKLISGGMQNGIVKMMME